MCQCLFKSIVVQMLLIFLVTHRGLLFRLSKFDLATSLMQISQSLRRKHLATNLTGPPPSTRETGLTSAVAIQVPLLVKAHATSLADERSRILVSQDVALE